jgi:hypothetical protein
MSRGAVGRGVLLGVVLASVALGVFILLPPPPAPGVPAGMSDRGRLEAPAATPELALRTVDRLQLFRTGNAGARLTLTDDEITALLRHGMPGVLPPGIHDPVVRLSSGSVRVEARLATDEFVGRRPLTSALGALPDTLVVDLRGRLSSSPERLVLTVEDARASGVPLPAAVVAAIANALATESGDDVGFRGEAGASFGMRWPDGVAAVAIVGDRLFLDRDEPMVDRAVDGSDEP